MKKQLDTAGIVNELKMGSRFFSPRPTANTQTTDQTTMQSTMESTPPSTDPPTSQSTDVPPSPSPQPAVDRSAILGRPKAFYISTQQDADLDAAVQQLAALAEGKVGQKIDRSTVVRLLLDQANLANPATAERLYGQLVSRLISQLTG